MYAFTQHHSMVEKVMRNAFIIVEETSAILGPDVVRLKPVCSRIAFNRCSNSMIRGLFLDRASSFSFICFMYQILSYSLFLSNYAIIFVNSSIFYFCSISDLSLAWLYYCSSAASASFMAFISSTWISQALIFFNDYSILDLAS